MKKFLISIDTEGDDLWSWEPGKVITTNNAKYLSRFQKLCDQFNFKPTYLTNYEMAKDENFVKFAKEALERGACEIGMHLHAWNTPPEYNLEKRELEEWGAPYLIEYPYEIMEEKIKCMTELLEKTFGRKPITHRAGRWAMDDRYYELLDKYGYIVDCTITPGINWEYVNGYSKNSKGINYDEYPIHPYKINNTNLVEIPMTIRENHILYKNPGEGVKKWIRNHYRSIKGQGKIWLRPNGNNLKELIYLVDKIYKSNSDDYIMFMLHSSELMAKGNPRFDNEEKIELLYQDMEILFEHISHYYEGITIGEYAQSMEEGNL